MLTAQLDCSGALGSGNCLLNLLVLQTLNFEVPAVWNISDASATSPPAFGPLVTAFPVPLDRFRTTDTAALRVLGP